MSEVHQKHTNRFRKIDNPPEKLFNSKIAYELAGMGLTIISIILFVYHRVIGNEISGDRQLLMLLIIYIFLVGRFKWGYVNNLLAAIYILYYTSSIFIGNEIKLYNLFYAIIIFVIIFGLEKIKLGYSICYKQDNDFEIEKRKSVEADLLESKKRYRRLIESIPDAVILHVNGEIVYANATAVELFGFSDKSHIKGRNIFEFIHEDYKEIIRERVNKIHAETAKVPIIEEKMLKLNGSVIDVEVASIAYLYDDKPASLIVIRDITERKQNEELRRSFEEKKLLLDKAYEYDRIKNEFFANISHELRTPLNVILSAIQIMSLCLNEENECNYNLKRYTGMVRQNCYRLLRLVNNLIDISKIDAGFYEIHQQNHNIVSIVEDITQSVVEYAREKNITIEFDTDTEEKIMACDPDKIERIVLNILSNSIKFTEAGGNIFVNLLDQGDNIKIILRDTGIGIPEDKINIVFERFRQANKSLIKNNQGSGIGLSLVKSLVELHSGRINVISKLGEGTEFIIELPVRLIENNESNESNSISNSIEQSKIERINIEFSDIYSNHQ